MILKMMHKSIWHRKTRKLTRKILRFIFRVLEMAALESVTEKLKVEDQMERVGRMNNLRNRAEEIVSRELIFAL